MENTKKPWYKDSFIRNLTDMHIPSGNDRLARFDPAAYAGNIALSGATTAYIYASNCLGLCFYPTNTGIRHSEAEKRDLFGETVAACRAKGLNVVGYLNAWGSFVCDAHPEWSVVDSNGVSMRDSSRFGNPCVNTPYRGYFLNIVREMCSAYDIDGLWVDMVGIWQPVCACEGCRAGYFAQTSRDLPRVTDWHDPAFVEYIRFKTDSVASFAREISEAARSVRPSISVGLQCAGLPVGLNIGLGEQYYEAMDYCAGDFYTGRDGVNVISRILYKLTPQLPFEFMTSRCSDLSSHTMNKTIHELTLQAFAAYLYNGSFLFIDAIDPDGGMNPDVYRSVSEIEKALRPFMPYIDYGEKPLRDIAVYINFDSFMTAGDNGKPVNAMSSGQLFSRLQTLARSLSEEHMDYDILSRRNLGELANYRVIILSSPEMMSEEETAAIREYVGEGGHIYISGRTSLLRSDGTLCDNFMLSDVIGADFDGYIDVKPNYILPRSEYSELFGSYNRQYPHMLTEACCRVKPHDDAVTAADIGLPFSDAGDFKAFSSAISNPPHRASDSPALLFHKFGEGEVIYSAGLPEAGGLRDNHKLFTALVRRLLGEKRFILEAPEFVDYTVYTGPKRYRIGLLSYLETDRPVEIHGIEFSLMLNPLDEIESVVTAAETPISYKMSDNVLHVRLSSLSVFEMIIVTLK
ncbi:MAG: alpha-L-fucosidase [Eubacteriales bacterium]|nr:alpha-L-fucosidase [Eubacteriales bacterium]